MKYFYKDYKFYLWTIIIFLIGTSSSLFTSNAFSYYEAINLPNFAPSRLVFGPVWTVLYLLLGACFYFILRNKVDKKINVTLFLIQLAINYFWSIFFFKMESNLLALIDIVLLDLVSYVLIINLYRNKNYIAANLFVPYVLWISFATALTVGIFLLN